MAHTLADLIKCYRLQHPLGIKLLHRQIHVAFPDLFFHNISAFAKPSTDCLSRK